MQKAWPSVTGVRATELKTELPAFSKLQEMERRGKLGVDTFKKVNQTPEWGWGTLGYV